MCLSIFEHILSGRKMMAKVKECYEKKQTVKLVGLLDKDENDEYIVCVEDEQYSLKDILEELAGKVICLSSEQDI